MLHATGIRETIAHRVNVVFTYMQSTLQYNDNHKKHQLLNDEQ